ncbi:CHASE2 domain-containing protein [Gloeothece verrucosa]|uniref:Putative Chase2 sensor protein n=1 Tax=Gloeothece verrucosa (strain PCC 7822) TaxID=497965 RepID=E0UM78_GLOV7|nr:CHASE2 domain-containing protein [Gloeothece verrucosa]ADN18058.1 putative Chase2 sensor protein [Gloeothece verrucosa PCC 7822]
MPFSFSQNRQKIALKAGIILGSSLIVGLWRLLGGLQYSEWLLWDVFFQLKPSEPSEDQILIVGFSEEDIKRLESTRLSDRQLASLLEKINQGKPSAIGVDFFRDFPAAPSYHELYQMQKKGQPLFDQYPVPPGHQELIDIFRKNPHIIGVGKQTGEEGDPDFDQIAPPPINSEQISDVSLIIDGDGVLRRGFLFPNTDTALPSLAWAVARIYLTKHGISDEHGGENNSWLSLNGVIFEPFKNLTGPYTKADSYLYQILINWRKSNSQEKPFQIISVGTVFERKFDSTIFKNKIVLVGTVAPSLKDKFLTPFNRQSTDTPREVNGVEVQAHIASQIIRAALDGRPLIKPLGEPFISILILVYPTVLLLLIPKDSLKFLILLPSVFSLIYIILAFIFFLYGYWIPVIPPLLSLFLSFLLVIILEAAQKEKESSSFLEVELTSHLLSKRLKPLVNNIRTNFKLIKKEYFALFDSDLLSSTNAPKMPDLIEHHLNESQYSLEMMILLLNSYFSNLAALINPYYDVPNNQLNDQSLKSTIDWAIWLINPIIFDSYKIDLKNSLIRESLEEIGIKISIEDMICLLIKILDEAVSSFDGVTTRESKLNNSQWIEIKSNQSTQTLMIVIKILYEPKFSTFQAIQNLLKKYKVILKIKKENQSVTWSFSFNNR